MIHSFILCQLCSWLGSEDSPALEYKYIHISVDSLFIHVHLCVCMCVSGLMSVTDQ